MLEQNSPQPNQAPGADGSTQHANPAGVTPFDMSRSLDGAPKFIPVRTSQLQSPASPISVAAPRSATAVPLPASPSQATASKLSDLVGRADRALPRLEARLAEEHAATDRAARITADIEERLKLGVRMLQAFDVQTTRGESIASRAVQAIEEVERVLAEAEATSRAALQADAERLAAAKLEEIARDLDAQRERFRQFESSAELLAKEKLDRIQAELDAQLARLKRADLDAAALSDDRVAAIRSLCDAQVDRLSRASADAVAETTAAGQRVFGETESHIARLAAAQREVDTREAERIEKFEAELSARLGAIVARAEEAAAAAETRAARFTDESIAKLEFEVTRRMQAVQEAETRLERAATEAEARTARFSDESIAKLESEFHRRIEAIKEAEARVERTMAEAEARTKRMAEDAVARLETELNWRIDRVREVEARIEHAANAALAAVDAELGARLSQIDALVQRADATTVRTDEALARMTEAGAMIERSERATAALAGLSGESLRLIETLAARVGDATALREVLGKLIHELAAAREVVQGDMRRMRDELAWLVDKSERLTGELIERADFASSTSESVRAITDAARPVLADLSLWGPLLQDPSADRVRPITNAITDSVREELTSDMHGFASALRQLASRADGAFRSVSIETDLLRPSGAHDASLTSASAARDLARSFERELSQLGPISTFSSSTESLIAPTVAGETIAARPPTLSANKPLDLEA